MWIIIAKIVSLGLALTFGMSNVIKAKYGDYVPAANLFLFGFGLTIFIILQWVI